MRVARCRMFLMRVVLVALRYMCSAVLSFFLNYLDLVSTRGICGAQGLVVRVLMWAMHACVAFAISCTRRLNERWSEAQRFSSRLSNSPPLYVQLGSEKTAILLPHLTT